MIVGFLALGVCTFAFASALEEALGGRGRAGLGPVLMRAAGIGTVAAGLLRRDRMLLHPPGGALPCAWTLPSRRWDDPRRSFRNADFPEWWGASDELGKVDNMRATRRPGS